MTLGILIIIGIVISAAVVLDVAHSLSASHGDVKIAYTTETYPASSGEEILIVNMTIQSEGASGFYVNPLNFNLTTGGTSYSYDSSTFELASVLPDDVTLQSNGTTSGAIAFLIPSGSAGFTLSYQWLYSYNIDWVNDGTSNSIAVAITTSAPYTASNISFNTPTQGNEYLIVNMTVKDDGYSDLGVSASDFTVTTRGVAYTEDSATFSLNNALGFVDLQSGGTASGGVAFQVPLGSSGYIFSYSPGVSGLYYNVTWVSA